MEWIGPGGSEVNVDAPHPNSAPDVFHIGYRTKGKGEKQKRGHIFVDCVPFFRSISK